MKNNNLRLLTGIPIFASLAFVVTLVCQIIPPVGGFLSIDFKDAIIAIASFIYGPLTAVVCSLLVAFIELITISTTGWYGFLMNFVSSAIFSTVAALIYRKWKSINGALAGFFAAVILTTSAMLLLNIFVTPLYMAQIGVPLDRDGVIAMIPEMLLPFNLSKSLVNSAIAMLLYKPIITSLRKLKLVEGGDKGSLSFNSDTVKILIVGGITLLVSVGILIYISLK